MRFLAFFIFIHLSLFAKANDASNMLAEAKSAFLRGDLYNANRFYAYVLVKGQELTETVDIENYIIANHHISTEENLRNICQKNSTLKSLSSDFIFYCGKTFMYMGDYIASVEYLEKVPKSLRRLEYHFVKATAFLKMNKTLQCLDEMTEAKNKITQQTSQRFLDALSILHARCYLAQGNHQKALEQFQNVNVKSEYYFLTIEEQAWAHFKLRNLVAARELLTLIMNFFSSQGKVTASFGADVYFRIRYLQGYIELITQNAEKSKQIFFSLNTEIKNYKEKVYSKIKIPKKLKDDLKKLNNILSLENKEYSLLKEYRDFIRQWNDQQAVVDFDKNIRFLVALNLEVDTAKTLPQEKFGAYKKNIENLREKQALYIVQSIQNYLVNSQRAIDSILFKSNMGQVENIWAERTEGKRTLAEVLDTYKNEVSQVEDYFSK